MKSARWAIAAVTLAAAGAAVWTVISGPGDETKPALFPELTLDALNTIGHIEINEGSTLTVSIHRDADVWRVVQHHDYPADMLKIRQLLTDLSSAQKVEQKTSSQEYYAKLGVADPGGEGGGKLLELRGENRVWRLIVGNSSEQLSSGQYVRKMSEETSWLIDVALPVPAYPAEWLETLIVHIEPSEIESVALHHPEDELPFTVMRDTDGNLGISDLPEGKALDNAYLLKQILATTDYLKFKQVFPRANNEVKLPEQYIAARVTAKGHPELTVKAYKTDDSDIYLIVDVAGESGDNTPGLRFSKWLYKVSPTVYGNLDKRLHDLMTDATGEPSEKPAEEKFEAEKESEKTAEPPQ